MKKSWVGEILSFAGALTLCAGSVFATDLPNKNGLILHLDASTLEGYQDGDYISSWPDVSGKGNDGYVNSDEIRPTYDSTYANGKPAVYFGGNASMFINNIMPDPNLSIFVVTKGEQYQSLIRWTGPGAHACFYGWANWCVCSEPNGFVNSNNINFGLVANEWNISDGIFDIGATDGVRVHRNNSLCGAVTWVNPMTLRSIITLASSDGLSEFGNCHIAEVIIYKRALSEQERLGVGAYLQAKYGIDFGFPSAQTPPTAVARDRSLVVNRFVGRDIDPREIDGGSFDDTFGIASMSVNPSKVFLGENEVELTVVNGIGISACATSIVTGVAGEIADNKSLPVTEGLRMHLDASALSGYNTGDPVSEWADASPAGHNGIAPEGMAPTYHDDAVNGCPTIAFDGTQTLYVDDMQPVGDLSIFVVTKGENYSSLLRWQYNGNAFFYGHSGSNVSSEGPGNGFMDAGLLTLGLVNNAWNISAGIFDVGATDGVEVFRNNVSRGVKTWPGAPLSTTTRLYIASARGENEFGKCEIAEIIIYDRAITPFEHDLIGAYLKQKYAIADGGYDTLRLANPITGSTAFTSVDELDVVLFPVLEAGVEYQLTASSDASSLDPAGWALYDASDVPSRLSFAAPASDGLITLTLWTRVTGGTPSIVATQAMTFSTAAPVAAAKNAAIAIDMTSGTAVPASAIDDGSRDDISGLFSLSVEPTTITSAGTVELVAMNMAGVTARATATITCSDRLDGHVAPDGDDANGTGDAAHPWRTITRALALLGDDCVVYAAPGTYDAAAGENFPIAIAKSAAIVGTGTGDECAIVDGGNAVASLFVVSGAATSFRLENILARETTDPVIALDAANAVVRGCQFTQSAVNHNVRTDWRNGFYGVASFDNSASATFEDCTISGIKRYAALVSLSGNTSLTLKRCRFENNLSRGGLIHAKMATMDLVMEECDFIGNDTAFKGGLSQCSYCSAVNLESGASLVADRCRFLGNIGANLIGVGGKAVFRNSLFAGNTPVGGLFQGLASTVDAYQCTFVRNSGGYSSNNLTTKLYNCILCGEGAMNVTNDSTLNRTNPAGTILFDSILWECGDGDGWAVAASSNVIREDPCLANAGNLVDVLSDDFDARPLPFSPAIDAGNAQNYAASLYPVDIDGNKRVADNNADGVAVLDIGAYESLFGATTVPTFEIPAPALVSGFFGSSVTFDVGIWPPADGSVTAAIGYPAGLTGPETLVIPDGCGPVPLTVRISGDMTDSAAKLAIRDSATPVAVRPFTVRINLSEARVNVGHKETILLRDGETIRIPVSFELTGAVAPVDVDVAVSSVSGDGENAISWNGSSTILEGASATAGYLEIVGVAGVNEVTLSIGGGCFFVESGEDSVTLTVAAYPGWMAVDPENGDDAEIFGSLEHPLRTVTRALSIMRDGDTVRMLPGTYTPMSEIFPWKPGNIALVGYNPDGDADPEDFVVTGSNVVSSLVLFDGVTGVVTNGLVGNLHFCDTTGALVDADGAIATVRNSLFTQSVTNIAAMGGIVLRDDATLSATDCVFREIGRIGAVYEADGSKKGNSVFTGDRCIFERNYSGYGTVSGYENMAGRFVLRDCDFIANTTPEGPRYYEIFPDTGVQIRSGGSGEIIRCRFIGGRGGAVLGSSYTTPTVRDCLFVDNVCNAGMFQGCGWGFDVYNSTFIRNSGGYNSGIMSPNFFNCIFCDDGALSVLPPDEWTDDRAMTFENTIIWNTPEGRTVGEKTYTNVIRLDPRLKNVAVAWDNPAFDAHPRSSSPAIDAGNNARVATAIDLDGAPRRQFGTVAASKAGGDAIVDLGCYEATMLESGTLIMIK